MVPSNASHTLTLSPLQEALLRGLLGVPSPPELRLRVRIILAGTTDERHRQVAQRLGCTLKTVRKWRDRGRECGDQLAEAGDDKLALTNVVARALADRFTAGAMRPLTVDYIVRLLGRPYLLDEKPNA